MAGIQAVKETGQPPDHQESHSSPDTVVWYSKVRLASHMTLLIYIDIYIYLYIYLKLRSASYITLLGDIP